MRKLKLVAVLFSLGFLLILRSSSPITGFAILVSENRMLDFSLGSSFILISFFLLLGMVWIEKEPIVKDEYRKKTKERLVESLYKLGKAGEDLTVEIFRSTHNWLQTTPYEQMKKPFETWVKVLKGYSIKGIAEDFKVSEKTIRESVSYVFEFFRRVVDIMAKSTSPNETLKDLKYAIAKFAYEKMKSLPKEWTEGEKRWVARSIIRGLKSGMDEATRVLYYLAITSKPKPKEPEFREKVEELRDKLKEHKVLDSLKEIYEYVVMVWPPKDIENLVEKLQKEKNKFSS